MLKKYLYPFVEFLDRCREFPPYVIGTYLLFLGVICAVFCRWLVENGY